MNQGEGMHWSVVMMEQPLFSPPQIRPLSPHCLSQPFHHLQYNIPCSPSGQEVEIHDELRPQNKKKKNTVSITFTSD